ncbi:hypothetical protein BVX93_01805 [bacterium B13(2017)]|nr:hypothetical protein BVX93_01805 [bacterium B13(2017)]
MGNFGSDFCRSGTKKTPKQDFLVSARQNAAEKNLLTEQRGEIFEVISIDFPNTIHGCKKLTINGRKNKRGGKD